MKLLEALEKLEVNIKKGKKYFTQDSGVCDNVSTIGNQFYHYQIKQVISDWKHFSGDLTYPIGGVELYNFHKTNESLWQGEQLKLRLDLIKFLKSKLKEK